MSDFSDTPIGSPEAKLEELSADNSTGGKPTGDRPSGDNPPATEVQIRCIRCQADFTGDRHLARFCPRCGARRLDLSTESAPPAANDDSPFAPFLTNLNDMEPTAPIAAPAAPPLAAVAPRAAQAAAWLQLSAARLAGGGPAATASGPQTPGRVRGNDDDVHSLMLLGYANAMYRLGWRYETGLGSGHNPQEALRCYFKAAKLGNIAALSRLAPQCVAPVVTPTGPASAGSGGEMRSGSIPPPLGTNR